MKSEVESIIQKIERTLYGEPWYGKAIVTILEEVDSHHAHLQKGGSSHTMLDILYHMITWAEFTLKRLQRDDTYDLKKAEEMDWRKIDGKIHTWKKGLAAYKNFHKEIITALQKVDDSFLVDMVDYRKYNFRFLLNGLIEHNIYHAGQIALLNKLPDV